jgi:Zn-dependent M28 family amino/carboxypeptidase
MTVELQSYVQEPANRIPTATTITNVVATLHGTDPTAADRVYVVGAHYDSRRSDVLDATRDAPGADDDGSGVSAVLELYPVPSS